VQKLKDRQFGKVQLFVPHKNPQAIIGNILLITVKEVGSFIYFLTYRTTNAHSVDTRLQVPYRYYFSFCVPEAHMYFICAADFWDQFRVM
jgi:hypothetical protein